MMWKPNSVRTTSEIAPGLRRNATSSNSFTITPRRNQPSTPPCSQDTLSAEYFFATSAKVAPPFFRGHEPGRAKLRLELRDRGELLAHVLDGLLDRVLHFLVRHLDRGVALRLLHQQLLVHHLREDLPPRGVAPRRVLRDLLAL